MQLDEQGWKFL